MGEISLWERGLVATSKVRKWMRNNRIEDGSYKNKKLEKTTEKCQDCKV